MSVGVLDHEGMLGIFRRLAGRRLLGAVDCDDCLELVFEDGPNAGNLVTFFTDAGRRTGLVAFGFVEDPERYFLDCRVFEEAA